MCVEEEEEEEENGLVIQVFKSPNFDVFPAEKAGGQSFQMMDDWPKPPVSKGFFTAFFVAVSKIEVGYIFP